MNTDKKKIILVDDSHYHLLSTKEKLKGQYEIYPAESAAIMFNILSNVIPDLILLDINMPEVDGFETIKQLKAAPHYAKIPVIFLTAINDKYSIAEGMARGAVDFISKPFSDSTLIECIEKYI